MKKRFDLFVIILSVGWLLTLSACSDDDGSAGGDEREYKGIPLVILDTDMGSSTDDCLPCSCSIATSKRGTVGCSAWWLTAKVRTVLPVLMC
ncbi:MAG: hypothetical protein IKH14_08245 [Prevotella sp.]|nr:hypothetical protein [Prevotella sp.]